MNNFSKFGLLGGVAVALSACGGLELGKAQSVSPKGSQFDQYLYTEYMSLSTIEYDEADYKDSDVFARRAIAAGSGHSPTPEATGARPLPAANVGELTDARARLVAAFAKGATDKVPSQAMYECWTEEQELAENFQPNDIALCRNGFLETMSKVEAAVMTAQVTPPAAKPMPAATPMPAARPAPAYMIYFDFNRSNLTPEAQKVVAQAVKSIKDSKPTRVIVSGYADRSGSDAYNMALSLRRAETVVDAFDMAGVKAEMDVNGYGEEQLHVVTPDGQREYRNRVVNIYLLK